MRRAVELTGGAIVTGALWLWAGAIAVVDWLGRAVILADISAPESATSKILQWLLSTPWYVPAFLAAIPTALAVYVLLRGNQQPRGADSKTPRPSSYGFVATGTMGKAPEIGWLAPLAMRDDQEINLRLYYIGTQTSMEGHLKVNEPYIDMHFWFINASVFTLQLDRLDGRMQFSGSDLQSKPEILDPKTVPATPRTIKHGEMREFVVRQWLSQETARAMLAGYGGANPTNEDFAINTGQVAAIFSYEDMAKQRKEMRKGF